MSVSVGLVIGACALEYIVVRVCVRAVHCLKVERCLCMHASIGASRGRGGVGWGGGGVAVCISREIHGGMNTHAPRFGRTRLCNLGSRVVAVRLSVSPPRVGGGPPGHTSSSRRRRGCVPGAQRSL